MTTGSSAPFGTLKQNQKVPSAQASNRLLPSPIFLYSIPTLEAYSQATQDLFVTGCPGHFAPFFGVKAVQKLKQDTFFQT